MKCWFCHNKGKTDNHSIDGSVEAIHPKCWAQMRGIDYKPVVKEKKTEQTYYTEKPPQDPLEKELNQLGGRTRKDLHANVKGEYVFMLDKKGKDVPYYLEY